MSRDIYIVEVDYGEYDDYGHFIDVLFTSEELAKEYCDKLNQKFEFEREQSIPCDKCATNYCDGGFDYKYKSCFVKSEDISKGYCNNYKFTHYDNYKASYRKMELLEKFPEKILTSSCV